MCDGGKDGAIDGVATFLGFLDFHPRAGDLLVGADFGAKLGGEGWACDTDEAFFGIEGMFVFWGKGLVAGANPETRNFG